MRNKSPLFVSACALGVALLISCGGGGGGSSPTVNYTGLTTPAVVTDSNASTLTSAAIEGGDIASVNLGSAMDAKAPGGLSVPQLTEVLSGLANLAKPVASLATGLGDSDTVAGDCGGTASLTGTDNSIPGHVDIFGIMTFSGFCNPTADGTNVVLNGSVSFTIAGTSTSNFVLTLNTTYLSATVGSQVYSYALSYSCAFTGGVSGLVTLTASYQAPDGKVYRIENYQVNLNTINSTLSIQGRFYHPDHGYVDVTTPVLLTYTDCTNRYLPTIGTLRVTGANGYAEFIAMGCSGYQVCFYNGSTTACVDYLW